MRLWHRVAGVLLEAVAPRAAGRLAVPDARSWRYPFHLYLHHAAISADAALAAGCCRRTAAFIRGIDESRRTRRWPRRCIARTRRADADADLQPIAIETDLAASPVGALRRTCPTRSSCPSSRGRSQLLLHLIESRQLDVLTVPLAELADAYVAHLAEPSRSTPRQLAEFVAVAAQLS